MTDPAPSTDAATRLRGFVLGGAVLFGLLLIYATGSSFRNARDLAETVTRGEAEAHFHAFHQVAPPRAGPPDPGELASLMSAREPEGLRYVALLDAGGKPMLAAGEPAGPLDALELRPGPPVLQPIGTRVRAVSLARRPPPRRDPGMGHRPPPPPPRVLIEFEPMAARDLLRHATVNLGLGIAGALLLLGAALVFRRMSLRASETEAAMFEQRHLASLGELSAVMAHEIRNPLASLKGHAQLLQETTPPDAGGRGKVDRIVDEAIRLEKLTTGLLDFARAGEAARTVLDPRLPLDAALRSLGLDLPVDDRGAPAAWSLDATRVQQALTNLLDNAVQASPEPGSVTAAMALEAGALVYRIDDAGSGVDPAARAKIFEPFHTTRTRGTGLGLAVVRRVAELHGGSVTVSDAPGGGASFRLTIPGEPA